MASLPPRVIGPLSECNTAVELRGQITGAQVTVLSNGTVVAKGTAAAAVQVFDLLPGANLMPGDQVVAVQDAGDGPSAESPDPVIVQAKPASVGSVVFAYPLYECGECTWISGAVPGATIEITGPGGTVRGSAVAAHGSVGVHLDPPAAVGEILTATQTACGTAGMPSAAPPAMSAPSPLPSPIILDPLQECMTSVRVGGIVPGAHLTVQRQLGSASGCYVGSAVPVKLKTPLLRGETVTVTTSLPNCRVTSKPASRQVGLAAPVPVPVIVGSLCEQSTSVQLKNLIPGARVRILVDGEELGQAEAPDAAFEFPVPPLKSGTGITAEQELCDRWSGPSKPMKVGQKESAEGALVSPTLYECGGAVGVTILGSGPQLNALVQIWSEFLAAPIGEAVVHDDYRAEVAVSPLLIEGDIIHARVRACGGAWVKSNAVKVKPAPAGIAPPSLVQPVEKQKLIGVQNVVPGALVEVFVNGLWRGARHIPDTAGWIAISGWLTVGDAVKARQRLCDRTSKFGPASTTLPLPPTAAFTVVPKSGPAPLTVQFTDQSTGAITSRAWDFGDGTTSSQHSPTHQYAQPGVFTATLVVFGPGGTSHPPATATVEVVAPDVPPAVPPQITVSYDAFDVRFHVLGSKFQPGVVVIVYVTDEYGVTVAFQTTSGSLGQIDCYIPLPCDSSVGTLKFRAYDGTSYSNVYPMYC